ncbi:DNA-directed RNA polymerase I subunit RPA49 [Euwallacea similis]|uniref:DNA-directed RNA polymerase I subunit RPA49 n=1 Tax=Euwallacea similis TaxID=1736056 RepID=UPI00344F63E0
MPKADVEENNPVLIQFQNGKIQLDQEKSLKSVCFIDQTSKQKIIGITNDDMVYSGPVTNYNTFLVVQNDNSKKVQLIQLDTSTITPLLQENTVAPLKSKESIVNLRKQFGSQKVKRAIEQQERLTMNIENVKEYLETTVADISVPDLPQLNGEESLYRPKINRDATVKEDVYNLNDLVPKGVLDTLEERVSEILENDDFADYELVLTVAKSMSQLRSSTLPERSVVDKCKTLLYVNYLVKFMNTPLKNMTKKFVACDCSADVDKHIKQNYMVNRMRSISMKDKGLCYIIVLLMLAMDFQLDLEMIAKDMKVGVKKMMEFARNLGFSPSAKEKGGIVLRIPVPPPVMPNLKRKRNV